jgi:hypothetical protein
MIRTINIRRSTMNYQSQTSPLAVQASAMSYGGGQSQTSPTRGQQFATQVQAAQVAASGTATNYWIELVAYPPGSARSLWLLVNNSWKRLDNPSASIQDVVQRAFLGSGSNVRVWFDGELIVGLVVEGS